jgi:transposase-like protein
MNQFASCPKCSNSIAKQVGFTWWGGVIGPKMFSHVKCQSCGKTYNGKTGKDNTTNIIVYSLVLGLIAFLLFAVIGFFMALK